MTRTRPFVAVGEPRLKQQIQHAIGLSPDFNRHPFFLPQSARTVRHNWGRRIVVLGSKELARYRLKNPARLKRLKRLSCVIVVLEDFEAAKILEAVRIADGLIFYEVNLGRMRLIAQLAANGYLAIPAALSAMMMNKNLRRELLHSLTTSESRVLGLLGRGSSNRTIGEMLQLDEGRTKYLIRSVFKKLQLQNRTQAAVFARDILNTPSVKSFETSGESFALNFTTAVPT